MKFFSIRTFIRSRYPPAIASGLALAAAFPNPGMAGLAWIAPALMLAVALGKGGGGSFRLGYAAGLAHYLASLYWLLLIPVTGFPILGWTALCAYLALYPATWVWLVLRVSGVRRQVSGAAENPGSWLAAVGELASWSWARRMAWALSCAVIWVALETILSRLFSGFPWNLLAASQHRILPLIQIASVAGVPGISFLIVWTSASLLCAAAVIIHRPHLRSAWMGEILLPLTAVVAVFAFGFRELQQAPAPGREIRITMVQPSIPQTMIWDADSGQKRFGELLRLSEAALTNETDILIWPEAAVPSFAAWDTNLYPAITNLARRHGVWLILGSDDLGPAVEGTSSDGYEYYNASFLVNPQGEFVARYKKRNLVIFGEYIPLVRWLPFVKWFTPIQGGFTPGDRPALFEMSIAGEPVRTSPLICFEDIFAGTARECAGLDVDFLVNLTNDGWFGESAAQWQQAAAARFRTVENRRPLLRCTNNGLTCWYDAHGRLRERFRDQSGGIHGAGVLTMTLPLPVAGERLLPTFYQRHGDWLGWGCVGIAAAISWLKRKTRIT